MELTEEEKGLDAFIRAHRSKSALKAASFSHYLNYLMGRHGADSPKGLYEKAGISKQAFYKMLEDEDYHPSVAVVSKLALALHLSNRECKYMMKKAGYTLASSSIFALVVRYCLESGIYDIDEVNRLLNYKGQDSL